MEEAAAANNHNKARRLPGLPDHIQEFGLCILFHLLLPLLPLVIEWAVRGRILPGTLFLLLAVYPVTIGVSSRSRLLLGATIVIGLVYSTFFGISSGGMRIVPNAYFVGYACLGCVILIHTVERYNRHVVDRELFWEFAIEGGGHGR